MNQFQTFAETIRWAGKNFAHNLKFVPEDKLHWKPAPDAASALEIAAHIIVLVGGMKNALNGGEFAFNPAEIAALGESLTLEEAQKQVIEVSEAYAVMLEGMQPADVEGTISLGGQPFPRARLVRIPVMDLMHHHGQLSYIQTMLGDTKDHFYEMGT